MKKTLISSQDGHQGWAAGPEQKARQGEKETDRLSRVREEVEG